MDLGRDKVVMQLSKQSGDIFTAARLKKRTMPFAANFSFPCQMTGEIRYIHKSLSAC